MHSLIKLGDTILKQLKGAPIGGVMSSALAVSVCVYSEHRWITSLGESRPFIKASRYVDDCTGVVVYNKRFPNTKVRVKKLIHSYKTSCYPKDLVLKPEPIIDGEYKFLETSTQVLKNKITVKHFLKNTESIKKNKN